jgi:hypothetical protein
MLNDNANNQTNRNLRSNDNINSINNINSTNNNMSHANITIAKPILSTGRRQCFSLNPLYPLIATSNCDNLLVIRNYETNQIVYKCYFLNEIFKI